MIISEIVRRISSETNQPHRVVREIIDSYARCMSDALKGDGRFAVQDVGVLVVKRCSARPGTNPRTGERVEIPERNRVSFRCSKLLKDALNK